ncbi:MAG TPA: hypothetical protein DCZ94_08640 [Lentisphaeria bacterium]|nr:MAG: hypothetical protein A2X48_12405 [Lentisphaerae bacterium GWF2_49_21]HBC87006.1 hypothetical protein [Lentisphaeria bacterium]
MTEELYNLHEIYGEDDTLTDKVRARKVFFSVSFFHVLFIAGPFLFFALWEKFYEKKPLPMQVSLLNLNPEGNKTNEPPGNPEPPKNEVLNKKKDDPKPPEPEEEEAVEEAPVVPPKRPVVEPPVKNDPKPKVPVPVEKAKPVIKPPEKVDDTPKKWEPKKPTEIIKSDKVVKGKAPTPKINANTLADKLKNIQKQCKVTNTGAGGRGGGPGLPGGIGAPGGVGTMPASYYDSVSVYLYELWKQPSQAELKGLKPTVTVHISIDATGNVRSAQITKKSGNSAMDISVNELLTSLKNLPKPPQGALELDVSLEIEDN